MRYLILIFTFVLVFQSNCQISDFESIDFSKADSIAVNYRDELLNNLPSLSHKLTANLNTDAEKFRSLFKWICINLSNDYGLYFRNKSKRHKFKDDSLKLASWNDKFRAIIFKRMVKNKRTICTGYAYLLKEFADLTNIECEIVHGYGRTSMTLIEEGDAPNHSWNVVKLDGKWYLADPTWASGIPNPKNNRFQFYFNDGYFLSHPELFAINHFPVASQWTLLGEDAPSFEAFLDSPILYGHAYQTLVKIESPQRMHNTIQKRESVQFNYQLLRQIEAQQVTLMIDSGSNMRTFSPSQLKIENDHLMIDYQFNQTGFYDVHLLIDDRLVSTHTVRVKNQH